MKYLLILIFTAFLFSSDNEKTQLIIILVLAWVIICFLVRSLYMKANESYKGYYKGQAVIIHKQGTYGYVKRIDRNNDLLLIEKNNFHKVWFSIDDIDNLNK